jgi:hypothetical protein
MSLTVITRSLLTTIAIFTTVLVVAPTAQADCKFQGSQRAGSVECINWASQQSQGSSEASGSRQTQDSGDTGSTGQISSTGMQGGGSTSSSPTCRDSQGRVVPCTTVNQNGNQCVFSGAIAPPPGGAGGGVLYYCPPTDFPGDDNTAGDSTPASGSPPGAPPVDPVVVVWRAVASMDLHAIDMQIAPAPLSADADSMGLVGLPVWLWTEPTATTWGPITASASDGPVSVTVTARVDRVEWSMGDGTVVTCESPGTPFDPTAHGVEDNSPDCGHVYQQVSRDPTGAYTLTATSYWVAEWSSGDETGAIPFDFTTSEQIRIGELQVLRTASRD